MYIGNNKISKIYAGTEQISKIYQGENIIYSSFSPLDLQPILWLDASDQSTIDFSSENNVERWSDKSGNGNHAVQTVLANQPKLENNTLRFQRTKHLLHPTIYFQNFTNFYLIESVKTSHNLQYYHASDLSENNNMGFFEWYSTLEYGGSFARNSDGDTLRNGTNELLGINQKYLIVRADFLRKINGVEKVLGTTWAGEQSVPVFGNLNAIGDRTDIDLGLDGYIYEVICFNRILSDSEINKVENYLNQKWNIY